MGQSSGSTTSVQNSEPWDQQGKRLSRGFEQADKLFGAGPGGLTGGSRSYFPGQGYVGFSPETESALKMTADRATAGSPVQAAGNGLAQKTLNGDFLQGNPYLDAVYNRGARAVTDQYTKSVVPSINSTFASAGRYGSNNQKELLGQASDNLGRTLSEMYSDMAMPTYEAERGRQMQTMGMAPQLAQGDYADAAQLANVGAQKEALGEQKLQDDMNRFYFQQDEPVNTVQRYMQLLQGNYGGTSASTTPIYRNRAAGAAGGAAAGSMFGPWGTVIGAGLGAFA
jgi:hypothetical protein